MFWLGTSFMNQATKQRLPFLPTTRMPAHIQYAPHTLNLFFFSSWFFIINLITWNNSTKSLQRNGMTGASVWYLVRKGVNVLEMAMKNCSLGKMSGSCLAASMVSNEAVPGFGTFFVRTASTYVTSEGHTFNISSCMCLLFHHARLFYRIVQHLVILLECYNINNV